MADGKIIATIGRKGGITKTTTTINLAAFLAISGYRVVVVDADGQGNTSNSMQVKPRDAFYTIITQNAEWADVLIKVPDEFTGSGLELYLLSSSDGQRNIESHPETGNAIYERFQELREWADFVLIDTSPSINEVNNAWFYTADYLLLPTLLERPAIENLRDKTFSYINQARAAATNAGIPPAEILGILPQRFEGSAKVQQANVGWLRGKYQDSGICEVFPFVRNLTVWQQAAQIRQSIFYYAPENDYNAKRQAKIAGQELLPVINRMLMLAGYEQVPV